jgi:hypothetical protein
MEWVDDAMRWILLYAGGGGGGYMIRGGIDRPRVPFTRSRLDEISFLFFHILIYQLCLSIFLHPLFSNERTIPCMY